MNGWIDDPDLPELQTIQLGEQALCGDSRDERKAIEEKPFNYKNTLTMRSENEIKNECLDLPSLNRIKGDLENFRHIGSVILESTDL